MLRLRPALLASVVLLGVAGCGDDGAGAGSAGTSPAALVPEGSPAYAEVIARPDGTLRSDVEAAAKKLLGTDHPGREVVGLVDKFLAENQEDGDKDTYAEDFEPWLGEKVGIGLTSVPASTKGTPDFAVVLSSKDDDAAKERLAEGKPADAKRTYKGVGYELDHGSAGGVLDGAVVIGTEAAFKQVVDVQEGAKALADVDEFKKARDTVQDDGLAFAYVKPSALVGLIGASMPARSGVDGASLMRALGDQLPRAVGVALDVKDDALGLDIAALGAGRTGGDAGKGAAQALADLPAGSSAAFGLGEVGPVLREAIKAVRGLGDLGGGLSIDTAIGALSQQTGLDLERDVLSWMGQGGVFVRAGSLTDLGGALVVDAKNPAKARTAVDKIAVFLRKAGMPVKAAKADGLDTGFEVATGQAAFPITVGVGGDKFVVAVGGAAVAQALKPDGKLGDSAAFKKAGDALGGDVDPVFFLDLAPVSGFLGFAGDDPDVKQVQKVLGRLTTVVAGARRDGDLARTKITVGLK